MQVPEKLQQSALRISMSDFTLKQHIRAMVEALAVYMREVYPKLVSIA